MKRNLYKLCFQAGALALFALVLSISSASAVTDDSTKKPSTVRPADASTGWIKRVLILSTGSRFFLDQGSLRFGSTIRSQPNTLWDEYKWLILAVLAICVIEAGLIYVLLRERRRRRVAQQRLEQEFYLQH